MRLSDQAVEKFKGLYTDCFKEIITDAEAREMADRVIRVFQIIQQAREEMMSGRRDDRLNQVDTSDIL